MSLVPIVVEQTNREAIYNLFPIVEGKNYFLR